MRLGRSDKPINPDLPEFPTIVHALAATTERSPDHTAIVCEEKSLTYAQYLRVVSGIAREVRRHGAKGRRVAILMNTSLEMSVACLGAMAAGAQIAPMNPAFTERELTPLMTDVAPAVIICAPEAAQKARAQAAAHGDIPVIVLGGDGIDPLRWADDASLSLPDDLPTPEDGAAMFFTGGTTGVPKGAEHTHFMMANSCRQHCTIWPMEAGRERILSVAPMFHIWGYYFTNVMPLYVGATLVAVPRYKPEIVLDAFQRYAITLFAGGPSAIYVGLLRDPLADEIDFSSLRRCLSGGAPCPEGLLREWERRTGCPILEGYGMSEGAPISSNPVDGERKLLSVGLPAPLAEIDIVDLETGTKVLPAFEKGEIRVRGPQFTKSYCNRPDETATAIRDGWLYTGDVGYLDGDNYLFIVDRKKEMILVGGYNVYPREIDEVLYGHPAVHEAAAVGMPDDFRGEVVKAFVALKPGATATEEELIGYCAERLVKYKTPVAIEILDALPKSGANKIDKLSLRGLRP